MMLSPLRAGAPATSPNDLQAKLARGGNNFNFVRLLLAALVLLSHSFELIDGNRSREPLTRIFHTLSFGELAVDGFFLVSGFLIVRSWQGAPQLWPYFRKRVLRIYPGFIAAFLVCLLLVGPLASALKWGEYLRAICTPTTLISLVFLAPPDKVAVFAGQPYPALNGAMWTIAYEFRCYILVALLGVAGLINRRMGWLILTLLLLAFHPLKTQFPTFNFPDSFYLFGSTAPLLRLTLFFLAGGCYYLFLPELRFLFSTVLLFLPFLMAALFNIYFAEIALSTLGAYIFFWFVFLPIPLLDRFKHHSDVSYGLYLYGWPVQKILLWYIPTLSPLLLFPLALTLSYGCGYLSWKLVERPALALKRRTPRDPRLLSASG